MGIVKLNETPENSGLTRFDCILINNVWPIKEASSSMYYIYQY